MPSVVSFDRRVRKIFSLFSKLGKPTITLRSNRLIIASSRSNGLLVAARTRICSPGLVINPSQCAINSFFIFLIASCSPTLVLCPSILSTSSMKIIVGDTLAARVNNARTFFSSSPNHFEVIVDIETLMKLAPASWAIALANMVFPVPGGPNSRIPLHGFKRPPLKRSGLRRGSITSS
uniref:Uncharacterized protein n=1 Tax=Opuntia streptacantha TaxID=393608 RepID=A0A7C9FDR4_OPUST